MRPRRTAHHGAIALALALMLSVAMPATVGAKSARTHGHIDIVAPTPDAVVGPGTASVHVDLALHGTDPDSLRVIVSRAGARRPTRHDVTDRFTIVTTATSMVLAQVKTQLERLVNVHRVVDLTVLGDPLERELALIKVTGKGDKRIEALRMAEIFRANVIDASTEHFVFEITGRTSKIEQFVSIMTELGLIEVSRTGIAAIARGPKGM